MKLDRIKSNVKIGEEGPFDLYALNDYDFSENLEFPFAKGVYVFSIRQMNEDESISHSILYVGQTTDLNSRFYGHHKAKELIGKKPNCLAVQKCNSEDELNQLEAELIKVWNPELNEKHPNIE